MTITPTEGEFLKDVGGHIMDVAKDDGVFRHIRFAMPGSSIYHFNITTWPGYLCISGDMGCFVFSRLADMLDFHRPDPAWQAMRPNSLYINLGYWSEKLRAGEAKKYEPEKFRKRIAEWLDDLVAQVDNPDDADLREAVSNEVLPYADWGHSKAIEAAVDFTHNGKQVFQDFWEVDCTEYTHHFVWCCYAIAWGLRQYDHWRQSPLMYYGT